MHTTFILHADLARAKDIDRLEAADRARRLRECHGRVSWRGRMAWWPLLAMTVLLGLALDAGAVTAKRVEPAGAAVVVERAEAGSVIAGEAARAGVSVSALLEAAAPEATPSWTLGASGRAGTASMAALHPWPGATLSGMARNREGPHGSSRFRPGRSDRARIS